jgi:anti-sigma regulatory factor (Ser/Thr protein kinase)
MVVLVLPASDSAQLARRIVTDALTQLDRSDLADDARLVVSELVANGVLHARTEISLSVEPVGDGIRVAVTDGSSVLPPGVPPHSPRPVDGGCGW